MSVDITSKRGDVMDVTNAGWRLILEFAKLSGWHPVGTLAPAGGAVSRWNGVYDPAMGQGISDPDAVVLGEAIAWGLEAMNSSDLMAQAVEALTAHAASHGYGDMPAAAVTEKTWDMLRRFAVFSKNSGGFRIE